MPRGENAIKKPKVKDFMEESESEDEEDEEDEEDGERSHTEDGGDSD